MSHQEKHSDNNDTPIYMAGRDIIINNYINQPAQHLPVQQQPARYQQPLRPSITRRVCRQLKATTPKTRANIAIFFGCVYLFGAVFTATSLFESFSTVLIALAFLLPGLWWYRCEKRDAVLQAKYDNTLREIEQSRALLDKDTDRFILDNLVDPEPPQLVQRRWIAVIIAAVCVAILSGACMDAATTPAPTSTQHQNQERSN